MTVINPQSISGITSITTASGSANLLTIHNNNGAERFRIDGSGNTRITSGIATSLEVASLSADAITGDISIEDKIIHTGDTNTAIRFPTADTVTVETGGSERIRVTSDGYFGVGQTPTTKVGVTLAAQVADGTDDGADWGAGGIFQLNASGSAAAGNEILLAGAHSGGLAQIASGIGFGRHNTSDWGTYLSFKTHAADTSNIDSVVERMRINSVGKVGINSTAPDGMLAIEHTSSAPNLTMRNHPAAGPYTNEYGLELRHAYGTVKHGALIHTQEAADGRRSLDVSDSNGVFATFVNGKVGVGTDIPSYPLHVQDTSQNVVRFETTKATDEGVEMLLYHNSASPADGDQLGYIQFAGNDDAGNNTIYNAIIGYSKDVTNGTEDGELRFYSRKDATFTQTLTMYGDSGDLKIHNGNLVLGTAGKGIDFSATGQTGGMTSELLDDYEEGTWTPDPWDGTCGFSNARYVRIGKQVTIWALCDTFSDTSTNDQIGITGIPFSSVSNGVKGSAMYRYADDANKTTVYFSSTPRIHFYGGNTGGYTQLRHNEINNSNFEVYFMATYDAT